MAVFISEDDCFPFFLQISTISPGNLCCEHTLNTLRYADRVKELGADGTSEPSKVFDDSAFATPAGAMSPHNSDLALLKTTNVRTRLFVRGSREISKSFFC